MKNEQGKDMNIYQKINAVRDSISYIQKDKSVSTGGGSYRAVTHDAVTAILRGEMIKQGIVCVPNLVSANTDPKGEGEKQYRYRATYSFDFVNADKPDEKVTIVIEAHAMDNADKAPGKAISYAKKYAVLKLFEIETGEDEESRYQKEEIDTEPLIASMAKCESLADLKTAYEAAYKSVNGDIKAQKDIITAKNAVKARIEKAQEAAA